jgi:hypothetical protein
VAGHSVGTREGSRLLLLHGALLPLPFPACALPSWLRGSTLQCPPSFIKPREETLGNLLDFFILHSLKIDAHR